MISDKPKQNFKLTLDSGAFVDFYLRYVDNQRGWVYSMTYGTSFAIYNRRIVTSQNMLRAFQNIIPFGLACATKDGYEPVLQTDFSLKRAQLYLLNSSDVQQMETELYA